MTYDSISSSELRSFRYDIAERVDRLHDSVRRTISLQEELQGDLRALRKQFNSFMDEDRHARNVHLAQTSLVDVRAQLDRKFGHHETVRRNTIGMLQAMDVGIVTETTLRQGAEHLMIDAPGYWLAPIQVALAAWIQDNPEVADRALLEAVSRDPHKATLFFSLVLARYGRHQATARWIQQYFGMQSRLALSSEFPVVLDAAAQGALGASSRRRVAEICISWLEQLSRNYDMVQRQVLRWRDRIDSERQSLGAEFIVLPAICPYWRTTLRWLEGATVHAQSERWLRGRLEVPTTIDDDVRQRVDDILRNLITDYDEAEAPLRNQEAECQAVIKRGGKPADPPQGNAPTRERRVDFLTLLTNIAMSPGDAEASVVTQQFAIGMASKWIEQAARELGAACRRGHPGSLEIRIHGWSRKVEAGDAEKILVGEFSEYVDAGIQHDVKDLEVNARRSLKKYLTASTVALVSIGLLVGFRTTSHVYSQIPLGIAALIVVMSTISLLWARHKGPDQMAGINRTWEMRRAYGAESIPAALGEVRKLFGRWEAAIGEEASFIDFIKDAAARQMSILPWDDAPSAPTAPDPFESDARSEGDAETLGADGATERLALTLPDWDLLPPHVATPPRMRR